MLPIGHEAGGLSGQHGLSASVGVSLGHRPESADEEERREAESSDGEADTRVLDTESALEGRRAQA